MELGTTLKANQTYALELAQKAKGLPSNCGDPAGIVDSCIDYATSYIPKKDVRAEVRKAEAILKPLRKAKADLSRAAMEMLGTGSRKGMPALAKQVHEFCDLYEQTVPPKDREKGALSTLRGATTPQKVYNTVQYIGLEGPSDYEVKQVFEERIKQAFGLSDKPAESCC